MKSADTCRQGWESKHPEWGSTFPNPCRRCGWSQADHASHDAARHRREIVEPIVTRIEKFKGSTGIGWLNEEVQAWAMMLRTLL
jgi:hypothetical protein